MLPAKAGVVASRAASAKDRRNIIVPPSSLPREILSDELIFDIDRWSGCVFPEAGDGESDVDFRKQFGRLRDDWIFNWKNTVTASGGDRSLQDPACRSQSRYADRKDRRVLVGLQPL